MKLLINEIIIIKQQYNDGVELFWGSWYLMQYFCGTDDIERYITCYKHAIITVSFSHVITLLNYIS